MTSIQEVLEGGLLRVVMQPIVDLREHRILAYESLVRSASPDFPDAWSIIKAAVEARLMPRLGRHVRELSLIACPAHALSINIHPSEFDEGWLVRPDDPIFTHDYPVYVEITESMPLTHFKLCHGVLREIRSKGVLLAVDDLGAGYSNLKYIADLAPEIVKLDRGLIAGLTHESRLQKLVSWIAALCEDLGARVVAEGIETPAELDAVQAAGVHFGQGYLLARPAFPLPQIAWEHLGVTGEAARPKARADR
jgi:EAL domain-containing protein (putative c-di-GMP-specific phosphodiesterase class I)